MRDEILALVGKYLPDRKLRPTGNSNVQTTCPFHSGGQEKTPSFSINVDLGLFNCFTCHESGDLRTFLKLLTVPAFTIDRELAVIKPHLDRNRETYLFNEKHTFTRKDPFQADFELPETLLHVYRFLPKKLLDDGFDPNLLQRLEIGYDRAKDRIMYPLRDMYGTLAGFSGGATRSDQNPKYLVYQGRRKGVDGRWKPSDYGDWFDERFPDYRCENHDFLWNFHNVWPRALAEPNPVINVVEGFKAAMWVIQSGYPMTVGLMGSYISKRQQQMLHRLGCTLRLFLDNDYAGRRATINIGDLLWWPMYGRVQVVAYPEEDREENTQPDDYDEESVRRLVENAVDFRKFYNDTRRRESWQ